MHSETPEETTELEQNHPDSSTPAPASESVPDASAVESSSRADRLRAWLSTHPLRAELLLAVTSVGLGFFAVPIVAFGSLVAIEGETGILGVGMILVAASLLSAVILSVALLVHAYTEIGHRGLPSSDGLDARAVAYGGTRTVETVTAGIFLLGLLASVVSLFTRESVPGLLSLIVGVAGILLPTVVFVHAAGALVGSVLETG